MPGKAKPKAKGTSRASMPRKSATKSKSPPKAGAKAKPGAREAKPIKVRKGEKVAVVLSGGNRRRLGWHGDWVSCLRSREGRVEVMPNQRFQRTVPLNLCVGRLSRSIVLKDRRP